MGATNVNGNGAAALLEQPGTLNPDQLEAAEGTREQAPAEAEPLLDHPAVQQLRDEERVLREAATKAASTAEQAELTAANARQKANTEAKKADGLAKKARAVSAFFVAVQELETLGIVPLSLLQPPPVEEPPAKEDVASPVAKRPGSKMPKRRVIKRKRHPRAAKTEAPSAPPRYIKRDLDKMDAAELRVAGEILGMTDLPKRASVTKLHELVYAVAKKANRQNPRTYVRRG